MKWIFLIIFFIIIYIITVIIFLIIISKLRKPLDCNNFDISTQFKKTNDQCISLLDQDIQMCFENINTKDNPQIEMNITGQGITIPITTPKYNDISENELNPNKINIKILGTAFTLGIYKIDLYGQKLICINNLTYSSTPQRLCINVTNSTISFIGPLETPFIQLTTL